MSNYRRKRKFSPGEKEWKLVSRQATKEESMQRSRNSQRWNSPTDASYQRDMRSRNQYSSKRREPTYDHQSQCYRQRSRSPMIEHSPRSHPQSTDRRRKEYQVPGFVEERESSLLWLISKHPELWDDRIASFRNKQKKVKAWNFINGVLGAHAEDEELKNHWNYLRRRYRREIIKLPDLIPEDFKHLMDTRLRFLKEGDTGSEDKEHYQFIYGKTRMSREFREWYNAYVDRARKQSVAQSSTSRQSRDRTPRTTTTDGRSSAAAIHRPSSPFFTQQASASISSNQDVTRETTPGGDILSELDSELPPDERDFSALDSPPEQVADEPERDRSPVLAARATKERNESNKDKQIADAVVKYIQYFSSDAKAFIIDEVNRICSGHYQEKV